MVTRSRTVSALLALCLSGGAAPADDGWSPFSGEPLRELLLSHRIVHGPDEQVYFASGRTRYTLLGHRWGWWEMRDGRYCDLWPPRTDWECFVTELSADGALLRFTGPDGLVSEARFEPLDAP